MTNQPPKTLRLSWSALRVHDECRQKARLIREGKRSPAKDLRNYYAGMVVDSVMQQWLADPNRAPGQMPAMVDHQIGKGIDDARATGDGVVRWRGPDDRAEVLRFCTELVAKLEPILDVYVLPYRFHAPFRFEVPVTVPYLDGTPTLVNLVGEMDLLVHEPSRRWSVWDLKGTADTQYWRRVLGQLVFYDLAVLGLYHDRTERTGLIQPMCPDPVLVFTVTDDMRRELWARIHRMAHAIWAEDFACKSTTSGCNWCEVRHACARYAPDADTLGLSIRRHIQEHAQ